MAEVCEVYQRVPVSDHFLVGGVDSPIEAIEAVTPLGFSASGYADITATRRLDNFWDVVCRPPRGVSGARMLVPQ